MRSIDWTQSVQLQSVTCLFFNKTAHNRGDKVVEQMTITFCFSDVGPALLALFRDGWPASSCDLLSRAFLKSHASKSTFREYPKSSLSL